MSARTSLLDGGDDRALLLVFAAIASRDHLGVTDLLRQVPALALRPLRHGASRQDPEPFFLLPIHHYVYTGDTALHVAAAAHDRPLAEVLSDYRAEVRARNRRGAEPLHYAADGTPDADQQEVDAQCDLIAYLIALGADPNATDKSGVAPLHRAVRNRTSSAVRVLIEHGADPLLMNGTGSTPLHLAVQNTGKSDSASVAAKEQQRRIIVALVEHGARPTDRDAKGKTVAAAATSAWVQELLGEI